MHIEFKNKKLQLSLPSVMGILNVTPDSFFDGGKYIKEDDILSQATKMVQDGVDIIDIGGVSTRPNATHVSEEDEMKRLIPAIKLVRQEFPEIIISADTFRGNVAQEAVNAGADIINDISGGSMDKKMFEMVGELHVPYILMHIQGTPSIMQKNPQYTDVVADILDYFEQKIELAVSKGITQIIIDPGFGFGKTVEHNYTLLKNITQFQKYGLPILVGLSRKSMLTKVLGGTPATVLNGTTIANTIALLKGANILRVHDVKEAKEVVKIYAHLKDS